jgi:MFS family permease
MLESSAHSVETRRSWIIATAALLILGLSFGAPWLITVALKEIAAEAGGARSVPSLAASLAWFGSGLGGIAMGRIAERVGVRWTVMFGATMIAVGLAVSTLGPTWPLFIGFGLFIGLLGMAGINSPFYVYVSKWFDRRRGSALALISSGTYVAGAVWPPVFERVIAAVGWRQAMLAFAALELCAILPLAIIFLRNPPEAPVQHAFSNMISTRPTVLGWPSNVVFAMLMCGIFMCCVPMAMPQGHLVAFCSDIGISRSHGAAMLSMLLGTAFFSRQMWGFFSDRIGGLNTVLIGSAWQAAAMAAFLFTQDEVGLFTVAGLFGLGFSGLIPATVLAVRELFPAAEASWRIPVLLLCSATGMATGGWLAGALYDHFGYYGPAFATGIAANLVNLTIVATLVTRHRFFVAATA